MTEASLGALAIGSPIKLEHCHFESARSTVGPIVRIKETGDICFLTAWHKFKSHDCNNDIYIGRKFIRLPRVAGETCGEIVAIQLDERVDAALVKIASDNVPKRICFDNVKEGQLEEIGLGVQEYQPTYDIDVVNPSRKIFHDQRTLKVVKFGCSSGVTTGTLTVEDGMVKRHDVIVTNRQRKRIHYHQQYIVNPVNKVFCEDGDTGSATFLIDTNYHLHCIGMVIRSIHDPEGSALVTPIQTILKKLGHKMGRTLELATFLDYKNDLFMNSGFDHNDKRQFEVALKDGKEIDKFVRLMIVGQYNQGKTSLTNRLLGSFEDTTESTQCIDVHINKGKIVGDEWITNIDPTEEAARRLVGAEINTHSCTRPSDNSGELIYERSSHTIPPNLNLDDGDTQSPNESEKDSAGEIPTSSVNDELRQRYSKMQCEDQSKPEAAMYVNIWDFGGQVIYYATHQIYHSTDAIYILVFDLRQDLQSEVVNEDFPDLRYKMTMKDHIKFWVYSIHSFVGSTDAKEPTIILVGTHKQGMSEERIDKKFYEILDLFVGKPARDHIYQTQFAVDNSDPDDENTKKLKLAIYNIGLMKSNKRHLPTRWIPLELNMAEEKHHNHILTFDELLAKFNKKGFKIKADELKAFLKYQNSKGNAVYFDEDDLREFVVIDPQFLVDAFKCILKSKRHCKWDSELQPLWNQLIETAVLERKLIEGFWNEEKFCLNKTILLNFLKRHKILAEILWFDENENQYTPTGKYMVPSLLKNECKQELLVSCLEGTTATACSIRLVFDDVAILRTLYERVSAALLAKWAPFPYKDQKMVFRDLGIYRIDHQYAGMIMLKEDEGLELTVIAQCSTGTFAKVCDKFRRCIENVIVFEFKRHRNNARGKPFNYQLSCNHADHAGKGSTKAHDLEGVNKEQQVPCPDNEHHTIAVPIAITQWFLETREIPTHHDVMQPPTPKDLCTLAESIGDNWILFGIQQLDLPRTTIERIKIDQSSSGITTVILYMLLEWQKSNPGVSLSALVEKMRMCESLSVHWDNVYNLLDQ